VLILVEVVPSGAATATEGSKKLLTSTSITKMEMAQLVPLLNPASVCNAFFVASEASIHSLRLRLGNWPEQTKPNFSCTRMESSFVVSLLPRSILAYFLPKCTYE
jgi:hypothetical protein